MRSSAACATAPPAWRGRSSASARASSRPWREHAVAVKPQLAFFEQAGHHGLAAAERVCAFARERGLLVIADGKRGDIGSTAEAYAAAYLAPRAAAPPFADALTVNPYLGADSLEPFAEACRASGGLAFVLVRTSNPGGADIQELELADGSRVWEHVARIVASLAPVAGAVVGATQPGAVARARELMPEATFLLPGVGAQGGDVAALGPAFAPGPAGGLVSASRSVLYASRADGQLAGRGRRRGREAARGRLGSRGERVSSARPPAQEAEAAEAARRAPLAVGLPRTGCVTRSRHGDRPDPVERRRDRAPVRRRRAAFDDAGGPGPDAPGARHASAARAPAARTAAAAAPAAALGHDGEDDHHDCLDDDCLDDDCLDHAVDDGDHERHDDHRDDRTTTASTSSGRSSRATRCSRSRRSSGRASRSSGASTPASIPRRCRSARRSSCARARSRRSPDPAAGAWRGRA